MARSILACMLLTTLASSASADTVRIQRNPVADDLIPRPFVQEAPASGAAAANMSGASVFRWLRVAPESATGYVLVRDAARLRRELMHRPIGEWLGQLISHGEAADAWASLARALKMADAELFDTLLGREAAIIIRSHDNAAAEWVIITQMNADESARLLAESRAKLNSGGAIIPEQDVIIARRGDRVIAGSREGRSLFDAVLGRMDDDDAGAMSDAAMRAQLEALGTGDFAVFLRHQAPLGGWSAATGTLKGDELEIRHQGSFASAPFMTQPTALQCDFSPIEQLEGQHLIAAGQPMDAGDGPVEQFVAATIGEDLIDAALREQLGERRFFVVGEHDARFDPTPADLLETTFVACVELKSPDGALARVDDRMVRLTRQINDVADGVFLVPVPSLTSFNRTGPRQVELNGAADLFTGGFPVMRTASLNWMVAEGTDGGGWLLVSTNPGTMRDVAHSLCRPVESDSLWCGRLDSIGTADGQRIGRHIVTLRDQVLDRIEPSASNDEAAAARADVRATFDMLALLAEGIERCRWQLARPSANEVEMALQVRLAPNPSAQPIPIDNDR